MDVVSALARVNSKLPFKALSRVSVDSHYSLVMHVTGLHGTGEMKVWPIDENLAGIEAWVDGTLIQNALPNLHEDAREFLLTGVDNFESFMADD